MVMKKITKLQTSIAVLTGAALVFSSLLPSVFASSHREAPLIVGDPKADATDLYAFVSPDNKDTVTFVANYIPFENPAPSRTIGLYWRKTNARGILFKKMAEVIAATMV